jgi:hypothetical protein
MTTDSTAAPAVSSAVTTNETSLIVPLHRRFEAAQLAWANIDEAMPTKADAENDLDTRRRRSEMDLATRHLSDEMDCIRLTLLWQVPTTDEDTAVLAFHVDYATDMSPAPETAMGKALSNGIASIFAYLVQQIPSGGLLLGEHFCCRTQTALDNQRFRAGNVEG